MKFKFCGYADCPDWVLAEINHLSKLSSVKLKLLTIVVSKGINNPPIILKDAEQIFAESKLDSSIDIEACCACIFFILTSAVRYNCDHNALHSELQQLGLPREHSTAIKKVADYESANIKLKLKESSLVVNPLQSFNVTTHPEINCVNINLSIGSANESILVRTSTVDSLLENLNLMRNKMIELNKNSNNVKY